MNLSFDVNECIILKLVLQENCETMLHSGATPWAIYTKTYSAPT